MTIYKQELNPPLVLDGLSNQDFLSFGITDYAYIRKMVSSGVERYVTYNAKGTPISAAKDYNAAMTIIVKNNLDVVSLH